jgi:hypothetical protein
MTEGTAVSETNAAGLPAWVSKRNGQREPFDADKICQALFAASEALGTANAFLARELTDAIVHFLAVDAGEPELTTVQIAEQVAKVVRELGQPTLAQAFEQSAARPASPAPLVEAAPRAVAFSFSLDERPGEVARRCLRAYTERAVFSRDLISAQADGLLWLAGLETPRALAQCVLETPHGTDDLGYWVALPELCDTAGQGVVLDGPEWRAGHADATLLYQVALAWLARSGDAAQRPIVINLNSAQPPAWAQHRDPGPLFGSEPTTNDPANPPLLDALLAILPLPHARSVRWDWHVQARDFAAGIHRERLLRVARHALEDSAVAFVFDRPRRPVALSEGLVRGKPAVLVEVGLDLDAFFRLAEVAGGVVAFHDKLPSLARMAVSAAVQKRKHLRRAEIPALERGFLLDRACLAVVPLGLNSVVRALTGHAPADGGAALKLAGQLLQRLHDCLQDAGRAAHLEVGLDSPGPGLHAMLPGGALPEAGLSCADTAAAARQQLTAAGALHAVAGQGTARVLLPHGPAPSPEELVELLNFAWRRTEVNRAVFISPALRES